MKKIIRILLVAGALLMVLTTAASAAAPYSTYIYSADGFVMESPDAYVPDVVVDSEYIGKDANDNYVKISGLKDVAIGTDNKVYLSDGVENKIYVLDSYYKYLFTITDFVNEQGVRDGFKGVSGLFVNDKYIYACDTDNNRIVMFDLKGNFVKTVKQPESALFNTDTIYKPVAVAVDSYGRLFIVSSTTYEGVIVMSDTGSFYGYIGAQKVKLSAWEIFWRNVRPSSASDVQYVSSEYNNITIDDENFIYVTSSSLDEDAQASATGSDYAPVKKLNASGSDLMNRTGFFAPNGEVKYSTDENDTVYGPSTLVDVAVGPQGTWSIIDQKRSKVFTYDQQGNLLFAFGDAGNQKGSIAAIKSVCYQGDNMILLDSDSGSFTVYRRTEYGNILIKALENQNTGNYDAEVDDWTEILKRNNNFDVAYNGIAAAKYRDKDYEGAMQYYKDASNAEGYSKAFKEVRKDWMSKYFWVVPVVIIAAIVAIAKFAGFASKKNKAIALKVGQKNIKEELLYAFHVIVHPFDGFWDLKHEKRGSVRGSIIILIVTVLAVFYQGIGGGYLYSKGFSSAVGTLLSILVPLMLWVIANWCLTTLFEGEGTFKDVFVASCYALLPLPLIIIPTTAISNALTLDESALVNMFNGIAFAWVGLLIFFGMMITHDYSLGKSFLTAIGTIVGMVFIMFFAVLFSTLLTKMISFIYGIVEEIQYRI